MKKENLTIVKIGGKLINDEDKLNEVLDIFSQIAGEKILVHGGGREATTMAEKLGIETKMIQGRRITDEDTIKLVTMVYAGGINKRIVAQLQKRDIDAIGLSGADANIIQSHKRVTEEIDYGFVGDVDKVNDARLMMMMNIGLTPVLSPITHDKKGLLLNTNADTIAAMTSMAFVSTHNVHLKYCFEFPGVMYDMNDPLSIIPELSESQIPEMVQDGTISKGMLPKIKNGFNAKSNGVENVFICGINNLLDSESATNLI